MGPAERAVDCPQGTSAAGRGKVVGTGDSILLWSLSGCLDHQAAKKFSARWGPRYSPRLFAPGQATILPVDTDPHRRRMRGVENRSVRMVRVPERRGKVRRSDHAVRGSSFSSGRFRLSSRNNQTLANFQSLLTVSGETLSASAVSSTVNPPKVRKTTTRLCLGLRVKRALSASSSASNSASGLSEPDIAFSNGA